MAKFKRTSQEEFLRIADLIRNKREEFLSINGWEAAAKWVCEHAQVDITAGMLQTACKAVGVFPKLQARDAKVTGDDLAVVVESQMTLMHEMGVVPSSSLCKLYEKLHGRPWKAPLPPIPVKSVTPTKEIAAVNSVKGG